MSDKVVFKVQGFSISMTDFRSKFKEELKKQKKSVNVLAERWLYVWAHEVQKLTRHYTPQFDLKHVNPNSLTNSIIITPITNAGDKKHISVGVSASWSSTFDEMYRQFHHNNPPWGVSRPALALFLHEHWGMVATAGARKRARIKSKKFGGAEVGERFLYRGARDASKPNGLKVLARKVFSTSLRHYPAIKSSRGIVHLNPERYDV